MDRPRPYLEKCQASFSRDYTKSTSAMPKFREIFSNLGNVSVLALWLPRSLYHFPTFDEAGKWKYFLVQLFRPEHSHWRALRGRQFETLGMILHGLDGWMDHFRTFSNRSRRVPPMSRRNGMAFWFRIAT